RSFSSTRPAAPPGYSTPCRRGTDPPTWASHCRILCSKTGFLLSSGTVLPSLVWSSTRRAPLPGPPLGTGGGQSGSEFALVAVGLELHFFLRIGQQAALHQNSRTADVVHHIDGIRNGLGLMAVVRIQRSPQGLLG